jgi:hypothetical protein
MGDVLIRRTSDEAQAAAPCPGAVLGDDLMWHIEVNFLEDLARIAGSEGPLIAGVTGRLIVSFKHDGQLSQVEIYDTWRE